MAIKPKQPTNQQPPEEEDDDAEAFTPKQLAAMNTAITSAVTSHVKRQIKPLQDQLGILPTIQETLEKLATGGQQQPAAGASGAGGAQGGAGGHAQQSPEFLKMQSELENLRKRDEQREREAAAERQNTRAARRDERLTTLATGAGVDKNRVRGVVALLRDQVQFDKEGNPIMKVQRDGYEEDVSLETGTAEFFRSDEGKSYIAPSGQVRGGSGGKQPTNSAGVVGGAGGSNNSSAKNQAAQTQERKQAAGQALVGAIGDLMSEGSINLGGGNG